MPETVDIAIPFVVRDTERTSRFFASIIHLQVPVADDTAAPVVAIRREVFPYQNTERHEPYRARDGVIFGRVSDIHSNGSRREITTFAKLAGAVAAANHDPRPELPFRYNGVFHSTDGWAGPQTRYVAVEDFTSVPLLAAAAEQISQRASAAMMDGDELMVPCSGPILALNHRSWGRESKPILEYIHSIEKSHVPSVMFDPQDPEAAKERLRRRYKGEPQMHEHTSLKLLGDLPRWEVPVGRLVDNMLSAIAFWFQESRRYSASRKQLRAIVEAREAIMARYPEHKFEFGSKRIFSTTEHLGHYPTQPVDDLGPLFERLQEVVDDAFYPGNRASFGIVHDYLIDAINLKSDLEDISRVFKS